MAIRISVHVDTIEDIEELASQDSTVIGDAVKCLAFEGRESLVKESQ